MRKLLYVIVLLVVCALSSGCVSTRQMDITYKYRAPLRSIDSAQLLAGAAEADITPPPGLPTAGHSIFGKDGQGFRTRLKVRAIYLKPPKGKPVVLVQGDLQSGSLVVHHRVAELIASRTDVDAGGLVFSGTHTHSGTGNYFSCSLYNDNASNRKGFNEDYFNFLSHKISQAVIEAYSSRKPARIATGSTHVRGVTKNRSLKPYLRNRAVKKLKIKPTAHEAVNPDMHIVRIDALDKKDNRYKPLAVYSNFAIHGNSNARELDDLYSADIYGFFERDVEYRLMKVYKTPWKIIHSPANSTHADNNPNYSDKKPETFKDMKRLSDIATDAAVQLVRSLDNKYLDKPVIRYRTRYLNLLKNNKIGKITIAKRPVVGAANAGGACGRGRDNWMSYVPMLGPGWPRKVFYKGEHGHKRTLGGPFQYLYLSKEEFPHRLLIQAVQVGDTVLLPLPWEVTYEMGKRLSAKAAASGKTHGLKKAKRYVVVSCSNGYFGYVNTSEEYSLQYYEGGSNYYGPHTGKFLSAWIEKTIGEMAAAPATIEIPATLKYTFKSRRFIERKNIAMPAKELVSKPELVHPKNGDDEYIRMTWKDALPGAIKFHEPLIKIETSDDGTIWKKLKHDGYAVDDSGYQIAVRCNEVDEKKGTALYEARWYSPVFVHGKRYRFVVLPRGKNKTLYTVIKKETLYRQVITRRNLISERIGKK